MPIRGNALTNTQTRFIHKARSNMLPSPTLLHAMNLCETPTCPCKQCNGQRGSQHHILTSCKACGEMYASRHNAAWEPILNEMKRVDGWEIAAKDTNRTYRWGEHTWKPDLILAKEPGWERFREYSRLEGQTDQKLTRKHN